MKQEQEQLRLKEGTTILEVQKQVRVSHIFYLVVQASADLLLQSFHLALCKHTQTINNKKQ